MSFPTSSPTINFHPLRHFDQTLFIPTCSPLSPIAWSPHSAHPGCPSTGSSAPTSRTLWLFSALVSCLFSPRERKGEGRGLIILTTPPPPPSPPFFWDPAERAGCDSSFCKKVLLGYLRIKQQKGLRTAQIVAKLDLVEKVSRDVLHPSIVPPLLEKPPLSTIARPL